MSSSPRLRLTYFNARGRGEISRLVLALRRVRYDDNRIEFPDWPGLKPSTPWGGLPTLEVDGEVFGQGIAISSYLAKEYGLYGSSSLEQLRIDSIALAREDLLVATSKWFFEKDEAKKEELGSTLFGETIPSYLDKFNTIIKENPSKSGYMVGSRISLADLVMFEGTQGLIDESPTILDPYPELKALRDKVANTDGIKHYLANRQPTPF